MAHDQDPAYAMAAGATFLALSVIVVALRFFVRSRQKAQLGADDWLVIPAAVRIAMESLMSLLLERLIGFL